MAQGKSRQAKAVTEEEESENTKDKMPESKHNANVSLIRLPAVDFLGGVKERGVKSQKKQTNLNEIWATQPTYEGRIITCKYPDVRENTVTPEEEILENETAIQLASTLS